MKDTLFLVFGAEGQLGKEFIVYFKSQRIPFEGFDLPECDITNPASMLHAVNRRIGNKAVKNIKIINCAAYTNVDKAESEKELCQTVNMVGARNCALIARGFAADLVYFSTDYIFNGKKQAPYDEEDEPDPLNYYGLTKLQGEVAVLKNCQNSYVVRISWLFGKYGRNFVKKILSQADDKKELRIVNDQTGSPTCAKFVVPQVMKILETGKPGVYHSACHGSATWFDFTKAIMRLSGKDIKLLPCSSAEYPSPAIRPAYSVLQNNKLGKLGIDIMPAWEEGLKTFLKEGFT